MKSRPLSAKLAIISLRIMIVASVMYIVAIIAGIYVSALSRNDLDFFIDRMPYLLIIMLVIVFFYYLMLLLTAISFITWMTLAYRNLQRSLPSSKFSYRPWMVVVVWFVPLWNLIGPYKIATQMFDKSERYLLSEGRTDLRPQYDIVKGIWWALWIASIVVIVMSHRYQLRNPETTIGLYVEIIGFILSILCAIFAIKMIRNYSVYEHMLREQSSNSRIHHHKQDDLLDSGF